MSARWGKEGVEERRETERHTERWSCVRKVGDSNDLLTLNTAEEMSSFNYTECTKYIKQTKLTF